MHSPTDISRIADAQAKYYAEVWVGDKGNFTPISQATGYDPLISFTIRKNINQLAEDLQMVCALGTGSACLSPYLTGGAKIAGPGGNLPALAEGREVMVRLKVDAPFSQGAWRAIFKGVIDDTNAAHDNETVQSQCRDIIGAVLMDTQIHNITQVTENGVTSSKWGFPIPANGLNEVLNIIQTQTWIAAWTKVGLNPNQNIFPGGGIIFPDPQAELVLNDQWQDRVANLGEALRVQALKAVYDLRGRWETNGIQDDFVCTCYQPNRLGTAGSFDFWNPDFALPGGQLLSWRKVTRLSRPLSQVRNVWEGTPFNADDPSVRVPQTVYDQPSVIRYGRVGFRFAYLSEDRTTGIDSPEEMADTLDILLLDHKTAPTGIVIEAPLAWMIELGDYAFVRGDGKRFNDIGPLTVTALEHHFDKGHAWSVIELGPVGAIAAGLREVTMRKWKGVYVSTQPPQGPGREGDEWYQVPGPIVLPPVVGP
jgi:hypothetical protein